MPEFSRAYSYRWINHPAELVVDRFSQISLDNTIEEAEFDDIENLIDLGNQLLNRAQYRRALRNFLRAYAMLARLISRPIRDCLVDSPIFGTVNLTTHLLDAGVEIARLKANRRWDTIGVVSTLPPSNEVVEVITRIDPRVNNPRDVAGVQQADIAMANAAAGRLDRALALANAGLTQTNQPAIVGQLEMVRGVILGAQQRFGQAEQALDRASTAFKNANRPNDAAFAVNNRNAIGQVAGTGVGRLFKSIARFLSPNPSPPVTLSLGRSQGNALVVKGSVIDFEPQEMQFCTAGRIQTVAISNSSVASVQQMFYAGRANLTDLHTLRIFEGGGDNVNAALPHLYHFVIPMAIGECYLELGQHSEADRWFIQASHYAHINVPVEVPLVWEMLAQNSIRAGHALFRQGDRAAARARYAQVARPGADPVDSASPLYRSPLFDVLAAEARAVVQGGGMPRNSIVLRVRLALFNITAIDTGVDYPLLSFSREQIPVFRFEYLQQVARYMAEQAIRAENSFIQFKNTAETEEAQRRMLEDAVALAESNLALEEKMVDVAVAQTDAARKQCDYVTEQRANARDSRDQYDSVSWDLANLDALQAWIGRISSSDKIRVTEGWGALGISTGKRKAADVAFDVSFRRSEINREFELDQMQRQIDNLAAAEAAANANVAAAVAQEAAADARLELAELRETQARDQLAAFESELFTPEVWDRLAREVQEIAHEYVQRAIGVAELLEEVFEFEIGEPLSIIRNDYLSDPISGMLAGQRLLSDIDSLEIARIATMNKHHPMKMVVSLAERSPFLFATQFQQAGRLDFTLSLNDLDWAYPGTYHSKIKRVEVVVEGLIGPRGVRGTLTNTGFSYTRQRDSRIQLRLLSSETMPLSEFTIVGDAVVFPGNGRELASFELAPVATSWRLEIPPRANDINFSLIRDVKLVVYFEALYDEGLRDEVILELLDTIPTRHQMTFDLGFEFPDTFFLLQQTGEVRFEITSSHLPFNHEQPEVERISFYFATVEAEDPNGLTIEVMSPASTSVTDVTANGGQIATTPGGQLEGLQGESLLGEWLVAIPQAANQARFDAGFTWVHMTHILMTVDYHYRRRPYPGDPQTIVDAAFSSDPMADFDAVDDPAATENTPGNWQYNAGAERVVQQSNIFGPAGAAGNGPNKPGSYLVVRTTSSVPVLRDLLISFAFENPDNDGVGFVFRYIDGNNFYFFLMDAERNYRRIGKKVAGVFQELDTPAVDLANGYTVNTAQQIKVVARGFELRAYLDNQLILTGRDSSLTQPGRFGFYSWGSQNVSFDNLKVFSL